MRHTLSDGRRIQIEYGRIQGLWEADERVITIDRELGGRGFVETLLHEILHAECPRLTEDQVQRTAESQARALWNVLKRMRR
jgi:hypothetical protein